jgi:hypothetical protein
MDKNKQIISVALGALVVVGAFLSVFGPILKNLTVEDVESEASLTADVSAPVTTAVNEQVPKVVPKTNTNSTSPVPVTTVSAYTFADVSNHNSATSCWSAVNGNVYYPDHQGSSVWTLSDFTQDAHSLQHAVLMPQEGDTLKA